MVLLRRIGLAISLAAYISCGSSVAEDKAGNLLDQVAKLHHQKFEKQQGHLFLGWLQMDEQDPNYAVYIGKRKYAAQLDDGRGTSQRAKTCKKENIFDEDPRTGCSISFDGEYVVEDNGGSIEVKVTIWNVQFQ
jgi:hypothetical protein